MYWEVINSVIKEIRISVPLFQHRLKCKLKKAIRFVYQDFQLSAGMSSFLRYVLAAL